MLTRAWACASHKLIIDVDSDKNLDIALPYNLAARAL